MKLGVTRFGPYSNMARSMLSSRGVDVIMPARITREMISLGVANSADMMCFPYKVLLGQQIWCLEQGATDLIMWDNTGHCRQKHYWQLQELTLKHMGYKFQMHHLTPENARDKACEILGLSKIGLMAQALAAKAELSRAEKAAYSDNGHQLRIGLVGEIYTVLENGINFDIVRKLEKMGASVDVSVKLSDFISHNWLGAERRPEEQAEAKKLLSGDVGGHGFESIYNTIYYGKSGFDGVIHLMPLSCMPESTVEPVMDYVAEQYQIPLYRFTIDEGLFEKGINTRLETFISMLRRRKRCLTSA